MGMMSYINSRFFLASICLSLSLTVSAGSFQDRIQESRGQSGKYNDCLRAIEFNLDEKPLILAISPNNGGGLTQIPDDLGGTISVNQNLRQALQSAAHIFSSKDSVKIYDLGNSAWQQNMKLPDKSLIIDAQIAFGPELLGSYKKDEAIRMIFGGGKGTTTPGINKLNENAIYETGFTVSVSTTRGAQIYARTDVINTLNLSQDKSLAVHLPNFSIAKERRKYSSQGLQKSLHDAVVLAAVDAIGATLLGMSQDEINFCTQHYFDTDRDIQSTLEDVYEAEKVQRRPKPRFMPNP